MARCREEVNGEIEYHLQTIKTYQRIHYKFSTMSDEIYNLYNNVYNYGIFSTDGQFERFSRTRSLEMDIDLKPTRNDLMMELTFTINHLLEGLGLSYRDYFNAQDES